MVNHEHESLFSRETFRGVDRGLGWKRTKLPLKPTQNAKQADCRLAERLNPFGTHNEKLTIAIDVC